ncbi:MAG: hypothetical protein ACXAEU_23355 [Candidatus Hodarchaeales archaeon]
MLLTLEIIIGFRVSGNPRTILLFILAITFLLMGDSSAALTLFIMDESTFILVQKFSMITSLLSIWFFVLFFELFENDTFYTYRQLILTAIAGMTFISILIPGVIGSESYIGADILVPIVDTTSDLLFKLMTGLTSLLIIIILYSGLNTAWASQKRQLKMMIVGVAIAYLLPIFFTFFSSFFPFPALFMVLLRADVAIGFVIYFLSFGSGSKNFGLFNRHKADRILIVDDNGLPLFDYNFKEEEDDVDEVLLSGVLIAMTQLMREVTKSAARISEVKLEDNSRLVLELRPKFLGVIITSQTTYYLRSSLLRFIIAFEREFEDTIKEWGGGDISKFEEKGNQLLFESFGLPI